MRRFVKGFNKRYFKLSSIVAHSMATIFSLKEVIFSLFKFNKKINFKEPIEKDKDLSCALLLQNAKVCNCAKVYLQSVRLILQLNHFISRCSYYTTWYAFRGTGVHPPFINSINIYYF